MCVADVHMQASDSQIQSIAIFKAVNLLPIVSVAKGSLITSLKWFLDGFV